MSRADYLSKYLNQGKSSKKLSKKLNKSDEKSEYHIIVKDNSQKSIGPFEDTRDEVTEAIEIPGNEDAPATVESSGPIKESRGFKRIDTGEAVQLPSAAVTQNNQNTVYRDASGRIIDIEERDRELKAEKLKKQQELEAEQKKVNSSDADRIKQADFDQALSKATRFDVSVDDQEYVHHMKKRKLFEDPLASFDDRAIEKADVATVTGRPVYTKGINPTNRFHIPAGYFWDGIDRSNGFEDKLVQKRNEQKVTKVMQAASAESYTEYDFD